MGIVKEQSAWELLERLRRFRPKNRKQLAAYVKAFMGLRIPGERICTYHDSPLDYLAYSFLGEDDGGSKPYCTKQVAGETPALQRARGSKPRPTSYQNMPPDFTGLSIYSVQNLYDIFL